MRTNHCWITIPDSERHKKLWAVLKEYIAVIAGVMKLFIGPIKKHMNPFQAQKYKHKFKV